MKLLSRQCVALLASSAIANFALALTPATSDAPAAVTIATVATVAIQAKLFLRKTGELSADVLAPTTPAPRELVNVVAGDNPSTSAFVIVGVALADGRVLPSDSRIRLIARETSPATAKAHHTRTLLDKSIELGAVSKGGATHIGFWLPDTGCRPVNLEATLTVARQPIKISSTAVIPFALQRMMLA